MDGLTCYEGLSRADIEDNLVDDDENDPDESEYGEESEFAQSLVQADSYYR